jgi:hypothetical protein
MGHYVIGGWMQSNQGLMMVWLTLAYVVATSVMVYAMLQSNSLTRTTLRIASDNEDRRIRPYVFFDIEVREALVYGVLRNTGLTPALHARLTLDPLLTHRLSAGGNQESGLTKFEQGLLPPGKTIEDLIDGGPDFFQRYPERIFAGRLTYTGPGGVEYDEPVMVDLHVYENISYTIKKDVGTELEKLRTSIEAIGRPR